jgi:alkyldihydroxyacetonephosphate synthase
VTIAIDRTSLFAEVDGGVTLAALEAELAPQGLTLGFAATNDSIASWLARGAPGAPSMFHDPADHLLAGLEATLANGKRIVVRPAPRRAVGPDLTALVVGGRDRIATIARVWIRIHPKDARRVREPLPAGVDLDPPPNDGETRLWDAIAKELS